MLNDRNAISNLLTIACGKLAGVGPQVTTRCNERLAPGTHSFDIVYDVSINRDGAAFFFNPIRPGSVATNERVCRSVERQAAGSSARWMLRRLANRAWYAARSLTIRRHSSENSSILFRRTVRFAFESTRRTRIRHRISKRTDVDLRSPVGDQTQCRDCLCPPPPEREYELVGSQSPGIVSNGCGWSRADQLSERFAMISCQ